MHSLAIETSGRVGSVAIFRDETLLAESTFEHGLKHAAGIVPMIDRLCRDASLAPADLRMLFISIGPGSFTGLRIGVTLAKTLAFATGAKIIAVPTAAVLAANAPGEAQRIITVLDAKRGQIFTATYERSATDTSDDASLHAPPGWREVEPARLDRLAAVIARTPKPVHLLGEGIPYHADAFTAGDPAIIVTVESTWRAKASVVAVIGQRLAAAGRFADADRLTPLYVRKPEAQEKWEKAQKVD